MSVRAYLLTNYRLIYSNIFILLLRRDQWNDHRLMVFIRYRNNENINTSLHSLVTFACSILFALPIALLLGNRFKFAHVCHIWPVYSQQVRFRPSNDDIAWHLWTMEMYGYRVIIVCFSQVTTRWNIEYKWPIAWPFSCHLCGMPPKKVSWRICLREFFFRFTEMSWINVNNNYAKKNMSVCRIYIFT